LQKGEPSFLINRAIKTSVLLKAANVNPIAQSKSLSWWSFKKSIKKMQANTVKMTQLNQSNVKDPLLEGALKLVN